MVASEQSSTRSHISTCLGGKHNDRQQSTSRSNGTTKKHVLLGWQKYWKCFVLEINSHDKISYVLNKKSILIIVLQTIALARIVKKINPVLKVMKCASIWASCELTTCVRTGDSTMQDRLITHPLTHLRPGRHHNNNKSSQLRTTNAVSLKLTSNYLHTDYQHCNTDYQIK